MKREDAILNYENRIVGLHKAIEIVKHIPKYEPMLFRVYVWGNSFHGGRNNWVKSEGMVAGSVIGFNAESLSVELIAVEKKGYPYRENVYRQSIKYAHILEWEPLEKKNFPLLLNYDFKYKPFQEAFYE
jgi:hypothetical protein